MNQQRFPYGKSTLISIGYMTNNLTWSVYNAFVPLFLTTKFCMILGENAVVINTLVGLVMILDNIAAVLIQPYIGARSDRTWIKNLGRRMPYVIIGIPLAAFFFGFIGSFWSTLWVLLVAVTGFNISMAFYKSPVMSLMPDTLPREYRSQGSGVLNVVGSIGSISGLVIVSTLVKAGRTSLGFWLLSILMIVCLAILYFNIKEKKDVEIEEPKERLGVFSSLKTLFKEKNKGLIILLFSMFFHTAGYNVVETFITPFIQYVLNPGSYTQVDKICDIVIEGATGGYILAGFVGFSVLMALPAGLVGRRIGALNACLIGLAGFIVAIIPITIISMTNLDALADILTFSTYPTPHFEPLTLVYIGLVILLAFSWLTLSINSIVVVWNLAPRNKTATYTSYYYTFHHLAAIVSPFLAGGIFDLFQLYFKRKGWNVPGIRVLFIYVSVCFVIALILLSIVKVLRMKKLREIKDTDEYVLRTFEEKEYPLLFLPMLLFGVGLRQEKALIELRNEQNRERRELKREISKLKRLRRKLKSDVILGDYQDLDEEHRKAIREHLETGKELRKEHREKRKELRDEIIKEKIKKKLEDEPDREKNQ
ncbi:MAG: MFS transporter [Candidatus Heimdallarchaeota archaeon]